MQALASNGGGWAVAGDYLSFAGQGEQAALDGVQDLRTVAAREVGAADAAGEKCVSRQEQIERNEVQADGALGVAGGVEDLSRIGVEADLLAVGEGFVWRSGFRSGDAKPGRLLVHDVELLEVRFVHENRRAGKALELERAADVVDVAVGDEDLFELEIVGSEAAVNTADFVTGVDDDGFTCGFVAKDGAVALQRADREGFEDHVSILGAGLLRDGLRVNTIVALIDKAAS